MHDLAPFILAHVGSWVLTAFSSHKRWHIKSHPCPKKRCRRSFAYKNELTRHMDTHNVDRKKLRCRYCGSTASRIDGYRRHLKQQHNCGLSKSALVGDEATVRMLLEQNPDTTSDDPKDSESAPLYLAAKGGHLGICEILLSYGADPDSRTGWYPYTALSSAIVVGSEEIVRCLLEKGVNVDVNVENSQGWTPLYFATYTGHESIVRLLLDHGAEADSRILEVSRYRNHEAIEKLLRERADTQVRDAKTD